MGELQAVISSTIRRTRGGQLFSQKIKQHLPPSDNLMMIMEKMVVEVSRTQYPSSIYLYKKQLNK